MAGVIATSGCPRSGTSMDMILNGTALGWDRIVGEKWPQKKRIDRLCNQQENESDAAWAIRDRELERSGRRKKIIDEFEKTKDLNPNGFWECRYTVGGLRWAPPLDEEIEKMVTPPASVVKIVSQGLAASDPDYIDRVVFMLRKPRDVARSQERLRGQWGPVGEAPKRDGEAVLINSARMFVAVTVAAAKWLDDTGVPFHIVEFDRLIANPRVELSRVGEFIGEGDWARAASVIDPRLKRSYPRPADGPLWDAAEQIYEAMLARDLSAVADVEIPERMGAEKEYRCLRLGRPVVENECRLCREGGTTTENFIVNAETRKIDWRDEPCAYEVEEDDVSIDESIAGSHWLPLDPLAKVRGAEGEAISRSERADRQKVLCENVRAVVKHTACCSGGRRPILVDCRIHGKIPWAACLSCRDWARGTIPAKT